MKTLKYLIAVIITVISINSSAQSKLYMSKSHVKDSISLSIFLKDLNKDLVTKESLTNKEKSHQVYKTLLVYYKKDQIILSPVKSGL